MLKWIILFVFVSATLAQYSSNNYNYDNNNNYYDNQIHWWDTDDNKVPIAGPPKTVPFPDCLRSGSKSNFLGTSALKKAFDAALQDEKRYAKKQTYVNYKKNYHDKMDDYDSRDSNYNGKSSDADNNLAAAAAMKLARNILTQLACDLNGTDPSSIENFLRGFNLEDKLCPSRAKVDCATKSLFRMPSGLCNNLERPFEGNAHTAFGRLTNANYEDHVGQPRRTSVQGGPLPNCRRISLELGSKPIFNRVFNNFFTIFGQYVAHDMALSVPVTDTYSTPISTCTCESRYSKDKCTVIDIPPDDPTLGGQKCMAFPETAQAFRDGVCTLGVKEQLNGHTHFIDLSALYGSSTNMAQALRTNGGQLKSTRRYGARILPPSQREGKSCSDGTDKYPCFAGGDSRLMINLLFTGIQTTFLRAHNDLAKLIKDQFHDHNDNQIYEITRAIVTGYFQKVTYADWLPILLGNSYIDDFNVLTDFRPTPYSPSVKPVVFNEVATAAFRLHTLVRDLFSRCTPDGTRIDQLWLDDILHKVKYAYDIENYGLDSIVCGALYDYGFAFDGNFAYQIHYRLFETNNGYGQLWRNDLVAINICRGREHGIPPYTKLLELCMERKVKNFNDLGYTINFQGIKLLKRIYKHVDDVDAFVGLNLEDPLPGALVGPTTACLLNKQFEALKTGDRFFYSHGHGHVHRECAKALRLFPYQCFLCSTVDIENVPANPFRPPGFQNELGSCSECRVSFAEYIRLNCFPLDDPKQIFERDILNIAFAERQRRELTQSIYSGFPNINNPPPPPPPAVNPPPPPPAVNPPPPPPPAVNPPPPPPPAANPPPPPPPAANPPPPPGESPPPPPPGENPPPPPGEGPPPS